jgi:MFS-type transporter involved in bile tolerance (Atg22 family)
MEAYRFLCSFAFTALFFALSTIPLFLWVKEHHQPRQLAPGDHYLSLAYRRIRSTFLAVMVEGQVVGEAR